jgi:hypothetical protein
MIEKGRWRASAWVAVVLCLVMLHVAVAASESMEYDWECEECSTYSVSGGLSETGFEFSTPLLPEVSSLVIGFITDCSSGELIAAENIAADFVFSPGVDSGLSLENLKTAVIRLDGYEPIPINRFSTIEFSVGPFRLNVLFPESPYLCTSPVGEAKDAFKGTKTQTESNRIDIVFKPGESAKCTPCEEIAFIQVMEILVDGTSVKPGEYYKDWDYRDGTALDNNKHVDRLKGRSTPYYGGNGGGTGHSTPGAADGTSKNATMDDTPRATDPWFAPGGVDGEKGKDFDATTITYNFETCAFCVKGEDVGKFFECVTWTYTRTKDDVKNGKPGKSTVTGYTDGPSDDFKKAVDKWDDAHSGFELPKEPK